MIIVRRLLFPLIIVVVAIFILSNGKFTLENLATELLGAILFTFMFFTVQNIFSPNLLISSSIAKNIIHENNETRYLLKFINYSFSSVRDIKISVKVVTKQDTFNGINIITEELLINNDHIEFVHGIWSSFRGRNRNNAVQLALTGDIESIIKTYSKFIEVRITCRDSVIGRERIFTKKYIHSSCIVSGHFNYGLSLDILE